MNEIDKAFDHFETNFYDYDDASVKIADPKVLKHIEAIIVEGSKLDSQRFKQLPLGIRVYIVAKMDMADMSPYIDAQMASCLLTNRPNSSIMQVCINLLSSWDESSGSLKLEGAVLKSQESIELLIDSLSETVKYNVKCLDLTKCTYIINLEKILSLIKAPLLLKINELYSLKSLKGIAYLADSLEELQAKDLYVLKSLEDLSICTKLKKIDLSNSKILDDIRPLQALVHLEELIISGCYQLKFIGDILPKLSNLKRLDLSNQPLFSDVSVLSECHALEFLDISKTAVEDVKPLLVLKKLKHENIITKGCKLKTL